MSQVAKIIELSSSSTKSFEDAVQRGIDRAGDTLSEVTGAWISDQKVVVKGGKIVEYRVHMRVTFLLKDPKSEDKRKK